MSRTGRRIGPRDERAPVRSGGVGLVRGAPRAAPGRVEPAVRREAGGHALPVHLELTLRHHYASHSRSYSHRQQLGTESGRRSSTTAALSARPAEACVRIRGVPRRAPPRARLAPSHYAGRLRATGAISGVWDYCITYKNNIVLVS